MPREAINSRLQKNYEIVNSPERLNASKSAGGVSLEDIASVYSLGMVHNVTSSVIPNSSDWANHGLLIIYL
jgi:hypothetical protein